MKLEPGLQGEIRDIIDYARTAAAVGNGAVAVCSTPHMIGLMELASSAAIAQALAPGQATVGIAVDIKHLAATPIGFQVTAKARLVEVDGRRLVFDVEAYDNAEKIGEGRHERFIVDQARFMERTEAKARR